MYGRLIKMENIPNTLEELSSEFEYSIVVNQNSTMCLFSCTQCFKNFSSKNCLTEHYYRHSKTKPYNCLVCDKQFRHASQFSIHKKSHNRSQAYQYPCLTKLEVIELKRERESYLVPKKIEIPSILGQNLCFLPSFISYFGKFHT